jgi:hypothetical protein
MRKYALLILLIALMGFCDSRPEVEKLIENGIEVIVNHAKSDTGSSLFSLKEEFIIDLEEDGLADLGLTDVWGFDVSSKGEIFIFKPPTSKGDRIVKFDEKGEFVVSFAPPGQGPGEIQAPSYQKLNRGDLVLVGDLGQSKIITFDKEGSLVNETRFAAFPNSMGSLVFLLDNGNYLIRRSLTDPSTGILFLVLSLFNSQFEEISELDRFKIIRPTQADSFRLPMHVSVWTLSQNNIYVGNEESGYEIHVYDFDGNLIRKIRKSYEPVKVNAEYKKAIRDKLEGAPDILKNKLVFPDSFPPYSYMFTDDQDNLYVKTYREGVAQKETLFDVFDPEGIFRGTVSFESFVNDPFFTPGAPFDSWVMTLKNGRLYALREKTSGYKQLVVYRVN